MKKSIFSIFSILLFFQVVFSQNGWVQINPGFSQTYNSVHFADANNGMACGINGAIIKTTNGGTNWTVLNSGTSFGLNDIKMFSPSIIIACGDNQIIIRSTNGGANWSIVYQGSPGQNTVVNLNIHSGNGATAYSWYYSNPSEYTYIYRSSDTGATWQVFQTYVSNRWIHFINLNTGWAYGSTYIGPPINQYYLDLNKTTNGGLNWEVQYRSSGISINPGMVYFFDATLGFKYSHIGNVYLNRSINGGYDWISSSGLPAGYSNLIRCFYFTNNQKGWFVADNSTIYGTTNAGANWVAQQSPVSANLKKVFFIDENTGWIAAGLQGILKTTSGGTVVGVLNYSNEIPESYKLNQNFPNPFNPSTKIRFQIPASSSVTQTFLFVYDVLGKEIATLVSQQLEPGTYEVEWEGSAYPSGVYFYTLQAENYRETKRMVLLK